MAEIDVEIIAGWIHVFVKQLLESDNDMEIGGLVVDEASQGQVAGKALVERAERWVIGSPTLAVWGRIFPLVNSFVGFAGRFVYEQSGGAATDGCWYPGSNYQEVTSTVTGGGWFVDQSGDWGQDTIGISSQADSFYQCYYGPQGQTCETTGPQSLYIDARTGPVLYIVDTQTPAEITPKDLLNGVAPGEGGPSGHDVRALS